MRIDIIILYILGFVAALLFVLLGASSYDPAVTYYSLICVLSATVSFIIHQRSSFLKYEWAKPSNLFFFALIIVYYQQSLDLVLGYKDLSYFVNPNVLNSCNLLSAFAIISYVLGYANHKEKITTAESIYGSQSHLSSFFIVLFQVISFILFVIHIDISSFLSGRDFGSAYLKSFNLSVYFEWFFQASIVAGLIVLVKNYKGEKQLSSFLSQFPKITLLLIILYLLLRLPSGDRGPVIQTIIAVFYAYIFATRVKIKLIPLLLVLIICAYGVSLIGIARNYDLNKSFSYRIEEAREQMKNEGRFNDTKSFFSPTQELSFSFLSYQVMVDAIVQDEEPYHYGAYQVFHILNAIPFAPSFLEKTMHIKYENLSSAGYATIRYLGADPHWGLGTNCVGEFFLDLGLLGVLLGMFFTGVFFKKIDYTVYLKKREAVPLSFLAFALVYSSKFLSLARGAILQEFKQVFLVIVILLINKLLTRDRSKFF